jgi:hypothetical protein
MRCDLARLTIDQMLDVGPLPEPAAALAAQLHQRCATDLASAMLDALLPSLTGPDLDADAISSRCQTTVPPVMVFLGDHPSDDPEVKRKRDLVFDACPEFAVRFRAFEAQRDALIRQQTTPPPAP